MMRSLPYGVNGNNPTGFLLGKSIVVTAWTLLNSCKKVFPKVKSSMEKIIHAVFVLMLTRLGTHSFSLAGGTMTLKARVESSVLMTFPFIVGGGKKAA